MKNINYLMDSNYSSLELINITSLESNSFIDNENPLFSSSIENNFFLNSNSCENFNDLNSNADKISSSLENNSFTDSTPNKEFSSLEKNLNICSSSSSINDSYLKESSNFNEDTPEIKSIEISKEPTKMKKHNKFAKDNIKRKIQVNYLEFLVNFINQLIKVLLSEKAHTEGTQFYRLDYKFAKDISKKSFNRIKEKTIGEIFKDNVSSKYKNNKKLNVKVYDKVTKKSEIIKKILDKPYLYFFYIYYSGQTIINLSDYGLDKTINLSSNTGFCKDIITKNNDAETSKMIYRKKILECIKKHFLTESIPIFLTINY